MFPLTFGRCSLDFSAHHGARNWRTEFQDNLVNDCFMFPKIQITTQGNFRFLSKNGINHSACMESYNNMTYYFACLRISLPHSFVSVGQDSNELPS